MNSATVQTGLWPTAPTEFRPIGWSRLLADRPPAWSPIPSVSGHLQLLGGFRAVDTELRVLELPTSTWRLVAYLALLGRAVGRAQAAGVLWMDKPEQRAHANLRSCLWRLNQAAPGFVICTPSSLRLGDDIDVDLWNLVGLARQIRERGPELDLGGIRHEWFCAELLPDWYDDFVEVEREPFRQLRLHSLEALAGGLREAGDTLRALDIALTAVSASPLRESAHRLVMAIHLDEGNISEALRQYDWLASLLRTQLGIRPSATARRLVEPWLPRAGSFAGG